MGPFFGVWSTNFSIISTTCQSSYPPGKIVSSMIVSWFHKTGLINVSILIGISLLWAFLYPLDNVHAKASQEPDPLQDGPKISGTILVVGNGPERYLLELLAAAFEARYPSISVDFFWHPNVKPIRTIERNDAEIGITGEEVSSLRSTVIARDGIAVLTNFSNPIKGMSLQQLADVLSGNIQYWSQVHEDAPQTKIVLINRSDNQNIRQGLEKLLNIPNGIPRAVYKAESEREAINLVTGNLSALTFVSMAPALRAKEDGVSINLLFIERVEPETQTVLDHRYPLQRPVVLLARPDPSPPVRLFEQFVLSQEGQSLMQKGKYYPLLDSQ